MAYFLQLFFLIFLILPLKAREWTNGSLPIHISQSGLSGLSDKDILEIKGENLSDDAFTLVLRIDDASSNNYGSRINIERRFPKSLFTLQIPLKGLRTTNHRLIDLSSLKNIYLANFPKSPVTISYFGMRQAKVLTNNPQALSFGKSEAPLFEGFERVTTGDSRIQGKTAAVQRSYLDPLIANGLVGVERITLKTPNGKKSITLYLEDVGEWETLPAILHQRIMVNGVIVKETKLKPSEWVSERYLKNGWHEPTLPLNLYKEYGARRGAKLTLPLEVTNETVTIDFAGEGAQSTFISALILEEGHEAIAANEVELMREKLFNAQWRIGSDKFKPQEPINPTHLTLSLAPDSGEKLLFSLSSDKVINPSLIIEANENLEVMLYAGQKRLTRRAANDTLFDYTTEFWRSDISRFPLSPAPRDFLLYVKANERAAGSYPIKLKFNSQEIIVTVDILPIKLPKPTKPAGFYHDEAPHLTFFPTLHKERSTQLKCDLAFMTKLGITGVSPSLRHDTVENFIEDLKLTRNFKGALLAYTPAKRMIQTYGLEKGVEMIAKANQAAKDNSQTAPLWSIADEPSNPDLAVSDIIELSKKLKARDPSIQLAAQFNSPHDKKFIPAIDVALINKGYGIGDKDVAFLKAQGKKVWFYNHDNFKHGAGQDLHFSDAESYLQWHSRMPTADPFDPTDGREGDVQTFLPSGNLCSSQPDVTSSLFEIAEGILEQRYLLYLQSEEKHQKLYESIKKRETKLDLTKVKQIIYNFKK